ncbi:MULTISPECIES: radical SAM family heme chaperone HemW [Rothia]|uniref:Heme chaperone HemW n=1 Tax=Rothia kristinae TaxID=37923 RepID=A0A147E4D2_9MICC|nr:radical SAM family heme chaperone HemW [Rothia kristinae]TDP57107.1 oxygen-independent coproporphyrinogen-3 oxidase [Kocuria sp. AG109]SIM28064.1 putative oxygen-independent coproporphyrinogen III oxidase [Mycobacteroides abscessus subsp. abscessus]KTR37796.1 coproporphyrinogen III oxidase [Rothia kristinae]KTR64148.1 coproporphyrinogen III oxidase [Rothia kristinae]KTR67459.1 coproporphyrinogen III oxidase [Rothia kristinae]
MSPAQPTGDPAPSDGLLPASVLDGAERRSLSLYVHVPYCSVRCGYCDFNTYAAEDFGDGVNRLSYAEDAIRELDLAAGVLTRSGLPARPLSTVFFGGGTPTRLPAEDLARILRAGIERFGIVDGAEVTTEANPDSVTREDLALLKEAGFTRVSFGMQSAVPRVLAVLDRTHTPANVPKVVSWAREVGLQTSVDLISGAPGETLAEWETSVRAAIDCAPDHISAYSLIVEPGTKLAAQIRRGELSPVDDDAQADMYLLADRLFGEAGYSWYEVSNWSRSEDTRSRHNLAYWRNRDWWGIGPGAHSHINGVRWWNLKHPVPYAHRVRQGLSPAAAREHLDADTRYVEDVMLAARIREGVAIEDLRGPGREAVGWLEGQGLIEPQARAEGRVVLTLRGRLLGDAVVRTLLGD